MASASAERRSSAASFGIRAGSRRANAAASTSASAHSACSDATARRPSPPPSPPSPSWYRDSHDSAKVATRSRCGVSSAPSSERSTAPTEARMAALRSLTSPTSSGRSSASPCAATTLRGSFATSSCSVSATARRPDSCSYCVLAARNMRCLARRFGPVGKSSRNCSSVALHSVRTAGACDLTNSSCTHSMASYTSGTTNRRDSTALSSANAAWKPLPSSEERLEKTQLIRKRACVVVGW
mmetsp:Transcript_4007/g.11435  ORF Transcript_4007/g.11435 Transcript_4007/m.11435 type:complete len:240 (-) Transcript_4007:53-772(-)